MILLMDNKIYNNNHTELNKYEKLICLIICSIFVALQLYRIIPPLLGYYVPDYTGYCIPDLMINYQGGFIRRGLLGELLYQMYNIHPYPLYSAVLWTETIIFLIIFFIMGTVYIKKAWFPIMPIALCEGVLGFRRDFLMLLLAIIVFTCLFKYVEKKKPFYIILVTILSTLSVFIYEPSFFFIVPISIFILWITFDDSKDSRTIKCFIPFIVPIISMVLVCFFKGSQNAAEIIWSSWQPMLDYVGADSSKMPAAINFLTLDTKEVMAMHLRADYGINLHDWSINFNQLCAGLLFLIGFYYLTIQMPRSKYDDSESAVLSDVFLFQFIFLIPMFTILSCDVGRTMNYVITTSFFITYLMNKYRIYFRIPIIKKTSDIVNRLFSVTKTNNNLWIYFFVLIFVPYGFTGPATFDNPFYKEFEPIFLPKIQLILSYLGL